MPASKLVLWVRVLPSGMKSNETSTMPLVQYLIANKALGMSPGKLSAQVAHGAVRSAMASGAIDTDKWLKTGETKIVLEARDEQHLRTAQEYIEKLGIKTFLVLDEGRTEIPPLSATVLASEVVDKSEEKVQQAFGTFKTYRVDPVEDDRVNVLGNQIKDLLDAVSLHTSERKWAKIKERFADLQALR